MVSVTMSHNRKLLLSTLLKVLKVAKQQWKVANADKHWCTANNYPPLADNYQRDASLLPLYLPLSASVESVWPIHFQQSGK